MASWMVGSEQGGLEAETAWPDAAKSSLLPRRWKKAVASDQLPSSELAAPQPDLLLARQKLSATTLKCPGSSGGANLQLWPAPLSGTRFVRSRVVASGGRELRRGFAGPRRSSFLGGAVPERAWGKSWWWGNGPGWWSRDAGWSLLHWLAAAARKDRGKH